MNDSLAYIASYFEGHLSADEKKVFEDRCVADAAFAEDVAAYIAMRDSIRLSLDEQKKAEFAALYAELSASAEEGLSTEPDQLSAQHDAAPAASKDWVIPAERSTELPGSADTRLPQAALQPKLKLGIAKISFFLAAASVIVVLGWALLFRTENAQRLSEDYIAANFDTLGLTMGAADSTNLMQKGITEFNARNFQSAAQIFEALSKQPAAKSEALKNLGITYLLTGKYEQSIAAFNTLAGLKLYANPGLFYKAIALMRRNQKDDKDNAKRILQEVVSKDLEGSKDAKIWLEKL